MAERKHITLIYQYNNNWIGGAYYILSIIKVFNILNDELKPALTIVYDNVDSINEIKGLNYPYINYQYVNFNFNLLERIVNRIYWEFGKVFFKKKIPGTLITNLYPVSIGIDTANVKNFYYWIPDFQEHYLPEFFPVNEVKSRIKIQNIIKKSAKPVVFSSKNAFDDYNKFYPGNLNKKEILHFVSMLNYGFEQISIDKLKDKFHITKPYYLVPNQFWRHKNQGIVIRAAKILKERGIDFQIVFTGKEYDYRNPEYANDLKIYVADNQLNEDVLFLGFIDRNEQLKLMEKAIAIIQPSLFEGWSTVVEDAKAIQQFVILSDIPLHREQMVNNCVFFDPNDEEDLALKITENLTANIAPEKLDYENDKIGFAQKLLDIF